MSKSDFLRIADVCLPTDQWNPSLHLKDTFTYIDIASIDRVTRRLTAPQFLMGVDAPSRARKKVQPGDVLVSTVRPNLNAVAVVPDDLGNAIASTGFAVLRPRSGSISKEYLYYYVRTPQFIHYLVSQCSGASYPAVTDAVVRQAQLPLPPLSEQQRIVSILDEADELGKLRAKADERTRDLIPAIFHEMFENTTHQYQTLGEISSVVSGITKGRRFNGQPTVMAPYLRVANVQAGYLDLSEIKTVEVLPSDIQQLELKKGDVLLTEGGDLDKLGRGAMLDEDLPGCIHQNHVFRVRVDQAKLLPIFFANYIQTPQAISYFLKCAKRTTNLASINMTQLRALPVPLPPLSLQQKFATRVEEVRAMQEKQAESRKKLDALFESLLHRAFAGEL